MKALKSQQGFTLIELVVVIVILGILAVTAAPKFINLQADARTGTLNAVKASMQSVGTLVHSKSLIAGNEEEATSTVKVNSVDEPIAYGYPRSNDAAAKASWDNMLELGNDFVVSFITDRIYVTPDPDNSGTVLTVAPTDCFVEYEESTGTTDVPSPVVTDCE